MQLTLALPRKTMCSTMHLMNNNTLGVGCDYPPLMLPGLPLPLHSEENTPLDLDDHGGRTFLRVLLHLTMHDYPPLVSGALHLLFRHFSQRQEVLMAFKQVH